MSDGQIYSAVIRRLLESGAHKATKFVSPARTVVAARVLSRGKIDKRGPITVLLSDGKPNFESRARIKAALRRKASFPVAGIFLKMPPGK